MINTITMKTTKFKVTWLNHETTLTEYQVRTYSNGSLVSALNRRGFQLGNGHDATEMNWLTETEAILKCEPYVGAPIQIIGFEMIQNSEV